MNSIKQLPSGHVLGVYGHFPEDSVSCFDDKDNFHVLPDDDSLITVDDFFMLTLENENNTVLERIEGNPIKSKERGSGTVTSAMLLELGLVLGADSRITREDDRKKKKEKKAAVKDSPTTHLKNVKAVADSLAQIQLEEKSNCPAFSKEDKIPKCIVEPRIVSELPSSCPICTKFGHAPEQCPWRRRLPFGVTQVGKGYEIYGRRVHILWCSFCDEIGHHRTSECPKPNKKIEKTRLWKEFFFPEDKDS